MINIWQKNYLKPVLGPKNAEGRGEGRQKNCITLEEMALFFRLPLIWDQWNIRWEDVFISKYSEQSVRRRTS